MADDSKPNAGIPGIHRYDNAAGGWGALKAVAGALTDQATVIEGGKTLLRANQPEGFDCPGCAWPDPTATPSSRAPSACSTLRRSLSDDR